jgi:hypothetical protein
MADLTNNTPPEIDDSAASVQANPARLLRRAVTGLAVVAFLYAAGCAAGVYFGVRYYRVVSAHRSPAVRFAQAFIVERVVLLIACIVLGRALIRYARAIPSSVNGAAPVDGEIAAARQLSCWQALTWTALLYAGWEITIAFMGGR